jgi:putative membrane protein
MKLLATSFVIFVAVLHFWFLILEMFLWRKPLGLKTFRNTPEKAEVTAVLAANQGLYNGFLATGLVVSLFFSDPTLRFAFQVFFLSCVIVAGLFGAWSVSRKILFVQTLPALIALGLVFLS